MARRGTHFAINEQTAKKLKGLPRKQRSAFILNELEDYFFEQQPKYLAETDKAWDAIHRALTDGLLFWDNGEYPLSHAVLGGELLLGDENNDDYLISLKTPGETADISAALSNFSENDFKAGYSHIDMDDYEYQLGFDDLDYSYKWFVQMKNFYRRAAQAGLYVIFTVDL